VVAEAGDGETGLALIRKLQPQVAVLDLDMPKLDGFAVAREIHKSNLPVQIIFLTIHSEVDLLHKAMDLGGSGYIVKESALLDIVNGVRSVAAGCPFVSLCMTARTSSASVYETFYRQIRCIYAFIGTFHSQGESSRFSARPRVKKPVKSQAINEINKILKLVTDSPLGALQPLPSRNECFLVDGKTVKIQNQPSEVRPGSTLLLCITCAYGLCAAADQIQWKQSSHYQEWIRLISGR
jgi:CheY-like chemotaxis protein